MMINDNIIDQVENCPKVLRKRFIADAETLLANINNKGEVDRRLGEMYGFSEVYARNLRLAWLPAHVPEKGTKPVDKSFGPTKDRLLPKEPIAKEKVIKKMEEKMVEKKDKGRRPSVTIKEEKAIIQDVIGSKKPEPEAPEPEISSEAKMTPWQWNNFLLGTLENIKVNLNLIRDKVKELEPAARTEFKEKYLRVLQSMTRIGGKIK